MLRALAFAVLLAYASAARAEPPVVPLPGQFDAVPVGPYAEVLEDAGGELRLADVASRRDFVALGRAVPNFGYSYSAFWLRFNLPRDTAALPMLALEIRFPSIDFIELNVPYRAADGLEYRVQRGGDQLPWGVREVKHRNHVFRISTMELADTPVYLRVQTQSVLTVPAYLWRPEALIAADRDSQLGFGLFYGLVLALAMYNLMLFVLVRDRVYLYYVLYATAFCAFLFSFDGLAFQYLWPGSVWWANHALATALSLTLSFGTLFAGTFLDLARNSPRANRALLAISLAGALLAFFAASGWLISYGEILRALSALGFAAAAIATYAAVRVSLAGFRPARFFLLAWGALLVFIVLATLRNFALVPTGFATIYGLHIGFALDVLLLSFALADRINMLKQETVVARAETRERELAMEQLRHLAQHDPLTGLPNRASMQQRLSLAIEFAKRNRKKLAVMLVDMDDFKHINDSRGHPVGDRALTVIAGRLRSSVRASDTVARYGGDEFVVLAGELDRAEDAAHIAEKIADMVSVPLAVDGALENVGCSIGISLFPDDAQDSESLIERADRAMYAAKAAKKRRYAFFSDS